MGDLGVYGRIILKKDLRETGSIGVNWNEVAQDMVQPWAVLNMWWL
jgi:hypothetical protein